MSNVCLQCISHNLTFCGAFRDAAATITTGELRDESMTSELVQRGYNGYKLCDESTTVKLCDDCGE